MKCAPTGLSWASATQILDSWAFHAQRHVGNVIDFFWQRKNCRLRGLVARQSDSQSYLDSSTGSQMLFDVCLF